MESKSEAGQDVWREGGPQPPLSGARPTQAPLIQPGRWKSVEPSAQPPRAPAFQRWTLHIHTRI